MLTNLPIILILTLFTVSAWAAEPAARRPDTEVLANACAGCHGTKGHSIAPTPSLAGKAEEEFIAAMKDFQTGKRVSSVMNRIAKGYTEEDIANLALYFKSRGSL